MLRVLVITEKLVQSSSAEFADSDAKLFGSIILARPLPDDATVATLKDFFPGAMDIAFPRQVLGARYVATRGLYQFSVGRGILSRAAELMLFRVICQISGNALQNVSFF